MQQPPRFSSVLELNVLMVEPFWSTVGPPPMGTFCLVLMTPCLAAWEQALVGVLYSISNSKAKHDASHEASQTQVLLSKCSHLGEDRLYRGSCRRVVAHSFW